MPKSYSRRAYSRRKKRVLPYGIYQIAKSASRAQAFAKRVQDIAASSEIMGAAANMGRDNLRVRRDAAIASGKGMYTGVGAYGIRKTLGSFAKKNKLGQRALDFALSGGQGMYTGSGDYNPDSNSLISKSSMQVVPMFAPENDAGIQISRREYVSEIYGPPLVNGQPEPFTVQSFSINPGLEKTFPWLSQLAQNYDEYVLEQCIFTFKSTTTESSNSDNGQVGTVIMATNYNAAAPNFTDKASMQHYEAACSARLTESLQHGIECDPDKRSGSEGLFVRANPVVTDQDLKTYDHGKFQIAIANPSDIYANVSLGELWVSYTITLRKSKFFTSLGLGISKDIFVSNGGETGNMPFGAGSATTAYTIPTGLLKGQQNNLGCLLQTSQTAGNGGAIKITFPAAYRGYLRIMFSFEGVAVPPTSPTFSLILGGNVKGVADLYGTSNISDDSPSFFIISTGASATVQTALFHVQIQIASNGIDNTFTWVPNFPGATVLTQAYCDISEYNSGFSGKATNTNNSDAPVLINSSGVIVVV